MDNLRSYQVTVAHYQFFKNKYINLAVNWALRDIIYKIKIVRFKGFLKTYLKYVLFGLNDKIRQN